MSLTPREFALGIVLVFIILYTAVSHAGPVVTPNTPGIKWLMCDEPGNAVKFRQPAGTTDLVIACTTTATNLTIKGCVGPHVKKLNGEYLISCDRFEPPKS